MMIIYVDMVLLAILMALVVFTCGYCWYRVRRLRQSGQVAILLRPTKVLFSHKTERGATGQLRTVVAYQNPFTGDYCVNKNRAPVGYVNETERRDRERWSETELDSPDSGLSDEYEPLNLEPQRRNVDEPTKPPTNSLLTRNMNSARHHDSLSTHSARENNSLNYSAQENHSLSTHSVRGNHSLPTHLVRGNYSPRYKNSIRDKNRVDKTWNWNYKEYQI